MELVEQKLKKFKIRPNRVNRSEKEESAFVMPKSTRPVEQSRHGAKSGSYLKSSRRSLLLG